MVTLLRVFVLAWMLSPALLQAAGPRLNDVLPHGGQRGTEVDLTLGGINLSDAQELLLYDSGMEVLSFEPPAPPAPSAEGRGGERGGERGRGGRGGRGGNRPAPAQQVKVRLRISEDCPLGTQRLRIRTATGVSDLQNFHVGALPVVEEVEPNTSFDQPQSLSLNVTVHGRIDNEDADYFVVDAKQGERLSVEVFGMRLGTSSTDRFFDPFVAILNDQRFELLTSDDTVLGRNDPILSLIVPRDGRYTVQIRDASYNGDARAYYLMHVGTFPRPLAAFPAGGRPGETVAARLLGDVLGDMAREFTLPTLPPERFGLDVTDEYGVAPSALPFRVVDLKNEFEQEPNDNRNQPTAVSVPAALNGIITAGDGADFFRFSAKKGDTWEVEAYAQRVRSQLDPVISILRADNGQQLATNDDSREMDSYLRFQAPEDGDYLISVRDHLRLGGPSHVYRVEITPVAPRLAATPLEFEQYIQPQIVVPRGGAIGLVVDLAKVDAAGPVSLRSAELPCGVELEVPAGWENETQVPILFTATEEAPVCGWFARIDTLLMDPNRPNFPLVSPLRQDILMVRGANNVRMLSETQSRLPIVVAEDAPFQLWIEPPKVPVVRGGTQDLVIHCERAEGFTGRVELRLLKDPPGCSAIRSIRLEPDKTEARVPFHANVDAPLKEWPIAMRGIARVAGNSPVEVCTGFVPIRVEERFVDFEFAKAAGSQGASIPYTIKVKQDRPFDGEAEVKLVGLPANAIAEPVKLTRDMQEVTFEVKISGDTPVGQNKNLQCEVRVPMEGESILHLMGRGSLRIDPAPAAAPNAPPAPPPAPGAQPLSRLDQLRQQQHPAGETP